MIANLEGDDGDGRSRRQWQSLKATMAMADLEGDGGDGKA